MSEKNGSSPGKPDVEALRAEIKQTRSELGETVQALAAKADVKARAREQVEQTKQRVRAQAVEATSKVREAADRMLGQAPAADDGVPDDLVEPGPAGVSIRERGVPIGLVVAGVAAVVGIILLVRARRR